MEALNGFSIMGVPLFALVGFLFASYAIVANDVIQTLGTFLSSNAKRPWLILWAFAATIIVAVMAYGWFFNSGDIAFDRLNSIPYPQTGIQWWHVLPPLVLLILTRYGIPVSTTFLVLTIFTLSGGAATEGVLGSMLFKSMMGYLVAFAAAAAVYVIISRMFEKWVSKTDVSDHHGGVFAVPMVAGLGSVLLYLLLVGPVFPDVSAINWMNYGIALACLVVVGVVTLRFNTWYVMQWMSTAFLWSQWLMQDLANIFVYLPRETITLPDGSIDVIFPAGLIIFATLIMVGLHAIIFAIRGGEIQKIVLSKTNTVDVRAATLVDFIYGLVLLYFKELNDIPMSTTWVFLGLLAGRELAISFVSNLRSHMEAFKDVASDVVRAGLGLVVSVMMALGLPWLATGQFPDLRQQIFGSDDETEAALQIDDDQAAITAPTNGADNG